MIMEPLENLNVILDVESLGLYGAPFSYGLLVGDNYGNILKEIYKYSKYDFNVAECHSIEEYTWVCENVIVNAGKPNVTDIIIEFYQDWTELQEEFSGMKLTLFADVPFPVETRFLEKVVRATVAPKDYISFSPYPLLCVTSIRRAYGLPDDYDRLENELPMHHPLMDARHSYRGLMEAVNLKEQIFSNGTTAI